jgi:hypothetical protein
LLIAIAVIAVFDSNRTKTSPPVNCGRPSIFIVFGAHVSPEIEDQCRHQASSTLFGSLLFFALPGVMLLSWPRLRRRFGRAARQGRWNRASHSLESPKHPSRFVPKPIEISLVSDLQAERAKEELLRLGNGGPRGSLLARVDDSGFVDARFVGDNSPRFRGSLHATANGSELRGLISPSTDERVRMLTFAVVTALTFVVALIWLISSAPAGRVDTGVFLVAGVGIFFALMTLGMRRLSERTFPGASNNLARALATTLDTQAQPVPTRPFSGRNALLVVLAFVVLQAALVGARVGLVAGVGRGVFIAAWFLLLLVLVVRVSIWWSPNLRGTELRVGMRHVNLVAVSDVRARGPLMSLSDGQHRVVVSSALGRSESEAHATDLLQGVSAASGARALDRARLVEAVAETVTRCPLDETTAGTLHRPATLPGVSRPGPRIDLQGLWPVALMLGGFAGGFVILALTR